MTAFLISGSVVSITRNCGSCNGTGMVPKTCNLCNGTGVNRNRRENPENCKRCGGTGKRATDVYNVVT